MPTNRLEQTKLNAISAKILHRKSLAKYESRNRVVLILTIIVPILFIIAQFVSVGTKLESIINYISFALSLVLICVSLISIFDKYNEKITIHKIGMKNNIYVANECYNLDNKTDFENEWFYRYVTEIDNQDNDTFSKLPESERQFAYREALKESEPGNYNVICPHCQSSPWNFKAGNCQLCGNTKTD